MLVLDLFEVLAGQIGVVGDVDDVAVVDVAAGGGEVDGSPADVLHAH